jgi:hypothetical protein
MGIHHGNRNGGLVNVNANMLFLIHDGAPFGKWWSEQSQLTAKWAFYIV